MVANQIQFPENLPQRGALLRDIQDTLSAFRDELSRVTTLFGQASGQDEMGEQMRKQFTPAADTLTELSGATGQLIGITGDSTVDVANLIGTGEEESTGAVNGWEPDAPRLP